MEINQEINEVSGFTKIGNDDVPNTTERTASATISVRDGETVMLGGFIKSSKSKTKGGVPLLKDIPLLGLLFSSTDKKNNRSELLVLMRPTVLSTPGDAARVLAAERERLPGIRQAEKDIAAEELQQSKKVK
jgi:general secretion pathway protein D